LFSIPTSAGRWGKTPFFSSLLDRARRVVEAFEAAERDGLGVVVVDGTMVDRPVVLQARRLLRR
jgi:citrate lyase beta subunit